MKSSTSIVHNYVGASLLSLKLLWSNQHEFAQNFSQAAKTNHEIVLPPIQFWVKPKALLTHGCLEMAP